jgi:nifR3 family TIM-barrel protein
MAANSPAFFVSTIPIYGRFILAPMDGFTDSPMRELFRSFGSAMSYSEFLNGIDITMGNPHLPGQLFFKECERPLVYQIYDDNPARFLEAAKRVNEKCPDIIDINLGCSVRKISNRGAGSGLLRSPDKVALIASSLVKSLSVPITAKIRLGWDESSLNYLEIAHILEDCGVSLIAVHARTRRQEFTGSVNWNAIAEVKAAVKIPVLGNGDILSYTQGLQLMEQTGCDGVMIGRAAIGNPWIFSGSDRQLVSRSELYQVISRHLHLMVDLYSEKIAVLMFRKHLLRYLSGYLNTPEIRRTLFSFTESAPLLENISLLLQNPNNKPQEQR